MKVGLFSGFSPPEIGGGHTLVNDVLRAAAELAPASAHRFACLLVGGEPPPAVTGNPGLEIVALRRSEPPWGTRLTRYLGRRARARLSPTVCPEPGFPAPEDPAIAAQLRAEVDCVWYLNPFFYLTREVPYLATVFDLQHRLQPFFPEVAEGGQWEWREGIFGTYLRRAAYVVTGTEAVRSQIERWYQVPAERIRVLRFPTPTHALTEPGPDQVSRVLAKYGLEPGYVFFPAQFWPHKNHVRLLRAIRTLRDEHELRLPAVFTGSNQGNLAYVRRQVEALDLADQVKILGFVPAAEIAPLFKGALALVNPSLFGPGNLPALEAFALGCPVISARVPGADEELGPGALLVDATDAGEIAEAILRVQRDGELRRDLVAHGHSRARGWTAPDFVRGVLEILDELDRFRACWPPAGA